MHAVQLVAFCAGVLSCESLWVAAAPAGDCFDHDVDYFGFDLNEGHYVSTASAAGCQQECQGTHGCEFWTWDRNYHNACWMKTAKGNVQSSPGLISGPKYCGDHPTPAPGNTFRAMSYNMYGWNALIQNPWKAENMYKLIRATNPDILGAQETENLANQVAGNIGGDYRVASTTAGHAIIYKSSVFQLTGQGIVDINEADQWGPRKLEYAHFTHISSGVPVDWFNTHLCVCDAAKLLLSAKTVASAIAQHRHPGARVVLTGDFNVFDGFENSLAIRYLKGELENGPVDLEDTFRVANPSGDGTTFPGAGKIDYILTDEGAAVPDAWIDRTNYGEASDHWPVSAIINLQ